MTAAIPVIDIGDYLAGRPGALQATARQIHNALTEVGFFVAPIKQVRMELFDGARYQFFGPVLTGAIG